MDGNIEMDTRSINALNKTVSFHIYADLYEGFRILFINFNIKANNNILWSLKVHNYESVIAKYSHTLNCIYFEAIKDKNSVSEFIFPIDENKSNFNSIEILCKEMSLNQNINKYVY